MSTKRKKPPLRNLQVLLARAAAEIQPGGNIAHVSMIDCCSSPLIKVEHLGHRSGPARNPLAWTFGTHLEAVEGRT